MAGRGVASSTTINSKGVLCAAARTLSRQRRVCSSPSNTGTITSIIALSAVAAAQPPGHAAEAPRAG
jgi:hypothetical protein